MRRWAVAGAGTIAAGLALGVPTDVVPTPLFTRMTPVQWWNYPVWVAAAVLGGLTLATYVRDPATTRKQARLLGGGVLVVFAIGCPVCNKLVVLLLGMSGALTWFAPAQPVLAVLSLASLVLGLRYRLLGERACVVPLSGSGVVESGKL